MYISSTANRVALVLVICLQLPSATLANEGTLDNPFLSSQSDETSHNNDEAAYVGWSLNVDNDLFTGGGRDRDYTGGIALAVTGKNTQKWLFSLDRVRQSIVSVSRFDHLYKDDTHFSRHTIEFGFTLFTPSDISIADPIPDDHPYASLFFVTTAAQHVLPQRKLSFQSVFTIGALGLSLADDVQSGIHTAIGSDLPQGWNNQISADGELTARYSVSAQKTVIEGGGPGLSTQLTFNTEANIGFTTDASAGFGMRWGKLERPWYSFNPHPAEYISVGSPPDSRIASTGRREAYFYAGASLKYRLYNAILQGQFRDSAVAFDREQLEPVIGEAWAGFLTEVGGGYRFGLFLRGRTAELDKSIARNPVWGGFLVSRSL